MFKSRGVVLGAVAAAIAVLLSACGGTRINRAPVEDKGTAAGVSTSSIEPTVQQGVVVPPVKALPGAENAGKPGYYTVKPGDTLIRIGLESGQSWRDIANWNNLENVNVIEVGQVLRVAPPQVMATTPTENGVVTRPVSSSTVTAAPVTVTPLPPASGTSSTAANTATPSASVTPSPSIVPPVKPVSTLGDEIDFIWPAKGALIAGFDEARNKGYGIAGKPGDTVMAAADGRVVYAGAGLRGYGNLVILKHNNTYLTAYAHNQTLLVKEDQNVRKGQKIAEMGNTDSDRVKLHFEIRKLGKPVDPGRYLPSR
jgi:lipoprotein NlpD